MSEIPKAYEPQSVEDKWYDFWLKQGCFTADPARVSPKRLAYSIVIPPPNVTGVLTMGHVLNNTIQDILARKARMDGKEVLWLPGTDHAGIATQTVVEKTLKKAGEIRHRDDLGREKFLERVWQWKEKHGGIIIQQLKKLGASCDWTRERFTMDPEYSRCVQKVFVELYKKGLIYRGKRMVNWCPVSLTALSDEEVIMKEQKGLLYYFKVEIAEAPGTFLTIATTRPETIPGDTAVAVNPKDPRYAKFIGKHVIRPLPSELPREQKFIPIIGDEHVDFEFGTGVLKVTPAHDKADFEIMARYIRQWLEKNPLKSLSPNATAEERIEFYNLASKRDHLIDYRPEVIDEKGVMAQAAGKDLVGLDRFKARKVAVEKLAEFGFLEKEEPYTNKVGFSERADVPIEPRLSVQWFLEYPSVEKSRAVVAKGEMRFHPDRWAKVYEHWMGGLQDWCVSRQLWWGHRIPVWSGFLNTKNCTGIIPDAEAAKLSSWIAKPPNPRELKSHPGVEVSFSGENGHTTFIRFPNENFSWDINKEHLITAATISEFEIQKLEQLGLIQDPDVLDTWFSSWLWPFATMGWTGDKSQDSNNPTLQAFYPTTDLVTGPDIIFFWVARMIMAGYEFMGDLPFRNVYFTGIIRDKQGRKMSKSLGNSPDPLDLIGKYGADALRFGTMRSAPLGQDILFDEQNVELGRNFCNKLWNACRFRQMMSSAAVPAAPGLEGKATESRRDGCATFEVQGEINPQLLTSDDKWILLKLDQAIHEITTAFAEYKFSDATATLYRFFWSEYCDWYVEASKAAFFGTDEKLKANTLAVIDFVLSHILRLFHPFLPFITEELWHGMGYAEDMPENQGGKTIMFAPWPKPLDDDFKTHYGLTGRDEKHIEARNELVTQGRNLRRTANIAANKKIKFILKPARELASHDVEVLKLLLNAEAIEVSADYQPDKNTLTVRTELGDLFLPLEGLIDKEAETARLKKELEKIEAEAAKVEQKLANPNFTQKVPANVLQEHQQRLAEWQSKREHVKSALAALQG
jgi:valyl-tRNA synthetase